MRSHRRVSPDRTVNAVALAACAAVCVYVGILTLFMGVISR